MPIRGKDSWVSSRVINGCYSLCRDMGKLCIPMLSAGDFPLSPWQAPIPRKGEHGKVKAREEVRTPTLKQFVGKSWQSRNRRGAFGNLAKSRKRERTLISTNLHSNVLDFFISGSSTFARMRDHMLDSPASRRPSISYTGNVAPHLCILQQHHASICLSTLHFRRLADNQTQLMTRTGFRQGWAARIQIYKVLFTLSLVFMDRKRMQVMHISKTVWKIVIKSRLFCVAQSDGPIYRTDVMVAVQTNDRRTVRRNMQYVK